MKLFDVYPLYEVTPVKANGVFVYDEKGKKYLDLYGGHAVISVGHSHPHFIRKISRQLRRIAFYSNAVQNPLQEQLASSIGEHSCLHDFKLFLCSTGAEAIENALKLSSFHTGRKKVIAFKGAFHGRTSAAVAVTDNSTINAPLNSQHDVTFLPFNDAEALEKELATKAYCAVIFESIQGVGGLDQPNDSFVIAMDSLCKKYGTALIADEVQSGFGRTGNIFCLPEVPNYPSHYYYGKRNGEWFPYRWDFNSS